MNRDEQSVARRRMVAQQLRDRGIHDPHVLRIMDIWRPGGGYVFQQVHNIMADVPARNVIAMFDAVNENA